MPDAAAARDAIRRFALKLGGADDVDRILRHMGEPKIVLLGEASHGTHEFYAWRAALTRTLIERHDFTAVAIEGDWPDAYRVNRYVQGAGDVVDAGEALAGFERFPTWMWRNTVVAEFVSWLRARNAATPVRERRAGFYGLDLYSLHASMRAVVEYLDRHDPEAALAARRSYACFEQFGNDTDTYAWATSRQGGSSCAEAVAGELVSLRARRDELLRHDGVAAEDDFFHAEQNARLAANAEEYYRTMLHGQIASWNRRDQHMAETLEALGSHLAARGRAPKIVVWAHNSHLGDARATEMGRGGELNLGQLVREKHGAAVYSIGFTTHRGTVVAADDWEHAGRRKHVRPALAGSYEDLLHDAGLGTFFLPLSPDSEVARALRSPRLERAIGVIYRPETERGSHYFEARLSDQFDAVIHLDETRAVDPLEPIAAWQNDEVPETFPTGV